MPDIFINQEGDNSNLEESLGPRKNKKMSPSRCFWSGNNLLSSFNYCPQQIDFGNQEKDEKVILLLRKHPIVLMPRILAIVAMALAPVVLIRYPILSFLPSSFQVLSVLGWYLITTGLALEMFLTWAFNVCILTNKRVIDIDFFSLIYKEVSDADIEKIQDVTYKMGGIIRTVFNYGDIAIQTASEVSNFEFLAVPRPDEVAKILQNLRREKGQEREEGREE